MQYNLLAIDSYVEQNLIKMLQLHDITKDIISLKDVDVQKLHDLVDEVITFNPNLSGKLPSTWKDAYKLLGIQAVMLHKIFFEELDMVAKEQLSLLLQHVNYNLTIELHYLAS